MDGVESKNMQNPPPKSRKFPLATQICMRCLAFAASLAAACIIMTTSDSKDFFGTKLYARYSYSSAFKFCAVANIIACIFSLVSLFAAVILARSRNRSGLNDHYYLFLHDLVMTTLVVAGCSAATTFGLLAKYGNSHAGWASICDFFPRFCNRMTIAISLSYFTFVLYLLLTIISANKSRMRSQLVQSE